MPPSAARPMCNRLTMPPLPALANASRPDPSEPPMPSAHHGGNIEMQKLRCRDRRAEDAGDAGGMKAERLDSAFRSQRDPEHDLAARDKRRDEIAARCVLLLRHRQRTNECGGTRMNADA